MDTPELDDWLDDAERPADYYEDQVSDEEAEPEGARPPWRIEDDGAADWCLRKMQRALGEVAKIQRMAKDRIDNVRAWEEQAQRGPASTVRHWRGLLEEYVLRQRAESGVKSISLPSGSLHTIHHRAGAQVTAPDLLLAWLDRHPELRETWCKVTVEPQVSRIKDHVAFVMGSVCDRCGHHIVMGWDHVPVTDPPPRTMERTRVWRDVDGRNCPRGTPALPFHVARSEGGEAIEVPVIVWLKDPEYPVPGLGVRVESTTARVDA